MTSRKFHLDTHCSPAAMGTFICRRRLRYEPGFSDLIGSSMKYGLNFSSSLHIWTTCAVSSLV